MQDKYIYTHIYIYIHRYSWFGLKLANLINSNRSEYNTTYIHIHIYTHNWEISGRCTQFRTQRLIHSGVRELINEADEWRRIEAQQQWWRVNSGGVAWRSSAVGRQAAKQRFRRTRRRWIQRWKMEARKCAGRWQRKIEERLAIGRCQTTKILWERRGFKEYKENKGYRDVYVAERRKVQTRGYVSRCQLVY